MNNQKYNLRYYLIFAVLLLIFYYKSLYNEFSLDDNYIFQNIPPKGSSFSDIFSVFGKRFDILDYRPIAMFTFAIEQFVFGTINPIVAHAINLFIYFIISCSVFYVLHRLPINNAKSIAFIAAILFIVHPVHAGTINNLKSRDGLFSMLFVLLAINSYINYENTKKNIQLLFIGLLFILGIIAKKDAYNILFILPILSFFVYQRKIKFAIIPAIVLIYLYILLELIINHFIPMTVTATAKQVLITENPLAHNDTFINRISMGISTYFYYLKFMFIPKGYYFYFGYNQIPLHPIYHYITILQLIAILLPLGAAAYFYKKSKTFTIGILIFYSCLLYCSNIILPVQGILADRYAFVASLGMFIAIAALLLEILPLEKINTFLQQKIWKNSKKEYIPLILVTLFILIYYPFVQARNNAWKNIDSLITEDMPHLTNSFEANRIASTIKVKEGMAATAPAQREAYFIKALQYSKQANAIYDSIIYTQETQGIAYYGLGKKEEAEKQFRKVIHQFDTSTVSWDLLGDITFSRKNYDSAALCYANVYRIDKQNEAVYFKYPNTLQKSGKTDSAVAFLVNLNKQYPDWYVPYESIAYLFYNSGKNLQAMQYLVIAFEKGLKNKATYNSTKQEIQRGIQQGDKKEAEVYKSLLLRLNKINI